MNSGRMLAVAIACVTLSVAPTPCSDVAVQGRAREPIIGGPCEGCEAVFEGLPETLMPVGRIAPVREPGAALTIRGTVYDVRGRPVPGVIVYAYHTDAGGVYPPDERPPGQAASRHGRLRGWVLTDRQGRYRFETIRPGSYPSGDNPAHVHMHVIEVGCCTYYVDSIHFDDDPLLTMDDRGAVGGRGGSGLVHPERVENGGWVVTRDIRLGEGVPGYRTGDGPGDGALATADGASQAPPLFATEPEWSRGGTLVLAAGAWPNLDIYGLGPDDSVPHPIVQHDSTDYMPSWSPNGQSIVFVSTRSGKHDLYVVDLASRAIRRLGADRDCESSEPRWSPDGMWIAFRADCDGNRDVYRIHPDGSAPTRLTTTPGEDGEPAWSPGSDRITFSSARTGVVEVYTMNADGTEQRRLTVTTTGYSRRPEWSPDGNAIAFGSNREGNDDIYLVGLEGAGVTNLSRHPAREYYSRWSPDGRRIAFTSNRERNGVIYEMARDGSGVRFLCCR